MAGIIDKLSVVQKFLNTLTWKKIAQLAVFLFVVALAWATYETRESIYNFATQHKLEDKPVEIHELSKISTDEIDVAVQRSDLIIAIQITIVDFQRNTRNVIYTSTDSNELRNAYQLYAGSAISQLPLFNNDLVNNRRLVDLINGEFICNPFAETIGAKVAPDTVHYIQSVCATGIPPFYGKFSGIVSIYTKRAPTAEEIDQIRTLSKNLASSLYDRDFK